MKKIIAFAAMLLITFGAFAQNDVKLPEKPKTSAYQDFSLKESGFWVTAGISVYAAFCNTKDAADRYQEAGCASGFDFVAGYRLNDFFRVGIGVSPRTIVYNRSEFGFPLSTVFETPLYLDPRGNFFEQASRNFAPYWSVDCGYTFGAKGIYASPTLGLKFGEMRNTFILGLTYIYQHQTFNAEIGNSIHYTGLKFAYEF